MTITEQITKKIIRRLLRGDDYRIEIVAIINADFLQFAIDFFKRVAQAKLDNLAVDGDWYKRTFLDAELPSDEIAINSGLNTKTIKNMYNTTRREVVIDASNEHYDVLYEAINTLIESENEIDLTLTIKLRGVSVDLTLNESLLVINRLAVKRAALRGGAWSTAGKQVEKPLMLTLCKLFQVQAANYAVRLKNTSILVAEDEESYEREIDFFLLDGDTEHKCEVKLMGAGNPESADAVIARASQVFVADKLSETNRRQLNDLGVFWVELRSELGFKKFVTVLDHLGIPHGDMLETSDVNLNSIFDEIFT